MISSATELTNAVLLALLPHVAQFAERLALPVPSPLQTNHVVGFVRDYRPGHVGGRIDVSHGFSFWFDHGHVSGFNSENSYFVLQDPSEIPRFFGRLVLTEEQALQTARSAITNLGYSLRETFTDQPPRITLPPRIGTNVVPRYRFEWMNPIDEVRSVDIEIDGATGQVDRLKLLGRNLWRPAPKVSGMIQSEATRTHPEFSRSQIPESVLRKLLDETQDFCSKANLPAGLFSSPADIEKLTIIHPVIDTRLKLTNGWCFRFGNGYVQGFAAPNTLYFNRPEDKVLTADAYQGVWRLRESASVEVARQFISRLGYEPKDFALEKEPVVMRRSQVGEYVFPRLYIQWLRQHSSSPTSPQSRAALEIDADQGAVIAAFLLDSKFATTNSPILQWSLKAGASTTLQRPAPANMVSRSNAPAILPKPLAPK